MYCPVCQNSEVPDGAANCSSCGAELSAFDQIRLVQKQRSYFKLLSIVFGSIIIIGLLTKLVPNLQNESVDKQDMNSSEESVIAEPDLETNAISWSDSLAARDATIASLAAELNNIKTQPKKSEITNEEIGTVSHVIKNGESLWTIAEKYYGDGHAYEKIIRQNNLSDANLIQVGETLIIPLNK